MATFNASVERNTSSRIKPVKRPLALQLLTLVLSLQPVPFLLPCILKEQPIKAAYRKHPFTPSSNPPPSSSTPHSSRKLANLFIDALAQACSCRQRTRSRRAQAILSGYDYSYHKTRQKNAFDGGRQIRHLHRTTMPQHPSDTLRPLSRDDYLSMLDYYRESYSTQAGGLTSLSKAAPTSSTPNWESDKMPPPGVYAATEQSQPPAYKRFRDEDSSVLAHLLKVLDRDECTHEEAFEAYSALPFPGVSYLSTETCHLLFHRLSVLQKKDRASKVRYLSVLDDMKSANLPMGSGEWNSAIAFCGQCLTHITSGDVENALRTWTEMEQEANVKGGTVTFNILFDMAAKAGKFVLAEMILKEMEDRQLKYNRYSRNSFIFYHGLREDGDGVRRAYREYVESGEIVDTVVLNTVITALIRSGEAAAAEQVYERMKRMHTKQTGHIVPVANWREVRDLGRVLNRAAQHFRQEPEKLRQVQEEQTITPDTQTYLHFVEYHASQTGEIRRIAALLTDMQHLGLPMHGRIFTKLFKGFAYHGGVRYTSWTRSRLEAVWASMLETSDEGSENVRVMRWMVVWAVRAFERCAGRQRTLEIWSDLRRRWKPGDEELDYVMSVLRMTLDSSYYRDSG